MSDLASTDFDIECEVVSPRPKRSRARTLLRAAVFGVAAVALVFNLLPQATHFKAFAPLVDDAHGLQRDLESHRAASHALAAGALEIRAAPFTVYYPAGHEAEARLVLRALKVYAPGVFDHLGASLPSQLDVIVTENGTAMDRALGISGAPPVGAYWSGALYVQAPSAWLDAAPTAVWTQDSVDGRTFMREGPVAHELAHAALDERLSRQPQTWFDEGVAQYEDALATGFVWREPANDFDQKLYSYEELGGNFDRLPNVALAYRQAYALVVALAGADGGHGLDEILARMADGATVDAAARSVLGRGYAAWRDGSAWK